MLVVDDFLTEIADGTEAVTVSLVRTSGSTTVNVTHALRQPMTRNFQLSSGVHFEDADTVWNVPDKELNPAANGRVIQPQDTIFAGGVTWLVQSATLATLGSRWQCVCSRKR